MRRISTFALVALIALKGTIIIAVPVVTQAHSSIDARDVGPSYDAGLEERFFGDKPDFDIRDYGDSINLDIRNSASYKGFEARSKLGTRRLEATRDVLSQGMALENERNTIERRFKVPASLLKKIPHPKIKPAPKTHVNVPKPRVQIPAHPNQPHQPPVNQAQQRAKSEQAEEDREAAELSGIHDNDSQLRQ
ncbi:hypothetical protein HYPSUDRAFT_71540 [Hypholoma sublateritium FD-334 SS-4]|uniref:SHSP domain-containing protein n=1 Tax=Hypholoma sublateritium (strain FD-334 SS-4) TaxID=945553 RepID=A0A0D2KNN4_HYPSF|nr:hypothetical protein HYPSUDRAFT_71540 [Hypholoma sublateritium FD-334 SS-4]